jgi:Spy/CpxP family protein refolding chaperone
MKNIAFLALAAAFLAACTPSEPTPPADPNVGGEAGGGEGDGVNAPSLDEQQK